MSERLTHQELEELVSEAEAEAGVGDMLRVYGFAEEQYILAAHALSVPSHVEASDNAAPEELLNRPAE